MPQTVIRVVLIVVQVDVVGLPAIGVLDDGPAAIVRPALLCDVAHDTVGDGHDGSGRGAAMSLPSCLRAPPSRSAERRTDLACPDRGHAMS